MKRIIMLMLFSIFALNANAQKKKKATVKSVKANVLAKADNLTAEISKNNLNVYVVNGKAKDSINIKTIGLIAPTDCKLKCFTSKNTKFFLISFVEKSLIQNPNKTEDITITNSEVYDLLLKTKVFTNVQKSTKITEKVFLDKGKNASETQEKIRNEGYTFELLIDGDISLTSKSKSSKLSFDPVSKQYAESKNKK